jgi:hypothetical protein
MTYIKILTHHIYIIINKMSKSRSNRSKNNFFRSVKRGTAKALPVIKTSLKKVGTSVKEVALPAVNKGLETVYNGLSVGVNMGIKGVKSGYDKLSKKRRKNRSRSRKRR